MQDNTGTGAVDRDDEKAIRELIERYARSAREGRLDDIMALYTPDVVAFDAIAALQFKGADAYRDHWEMCLKFIPPGGEMILEVHDPAVSIGGDIAFVHYLSRCGCIDAEGKKQVGWMRATVCCRRTAAGWRIAHEHYSSPFDPQSMTMLTDLEP